MTKKKPQRRTSKLQKSIIKNSPKIRPLGSILLDLEPLLGEMCIDHDLQWADVLNLVRGYLEVHMPGAQEEYLDNSSPVFYYGPKKEDE